MVKYIQRWRWILNGRQTEQEIQKPGCCVPNRREVVDKIIIILYPGMSSTQIINLDCKGAMLQLVVVWWDFTISGIRKNKETVSGTTTPFS